jgi:anti-sigma B factor antagonist
VWPFAGEFLWNHASIGAKQETANVGFSTEEVSDGITKVVLDGSLDIVGANAIDLKMNVIAGAKNSVLVDLQQVTFIGSMGLRALVAPARAILSRKGRIVIYGPTELVEKVLRTSGIDTMIPIFHDYDDAVAALQ